MKSMTRLLLSALMLISVWAQAQESERLNCGVSATDGLRIKERMLANRRDIPSELIQNRAGAVLYVPIQFTIVSDASGNGGADLEKVLDLFCELNTDFGPIGVQFYLKDSIQSFRYMNSNAVYNDAQSGGSENFMTDNKVPDCLNIYTGASVYNTSLSYYSFDGDYIFVVHGMMNSTSKVGPHETGHFFSLPHTFVGWEGYDFDFTMAPTTVSGIEVENVARTGPTANCAEAGDGFCDTDADYLSNPFYCPYNSGGTDPLGVPINPDELMVMSYFDCKSDFTQEQGTAMLADIYARGWDSFEQPLPDDLVDEASVTSFDPPDGSAFPFGATITLSWNKVAGANGYVLWLQKSTTTILKTDVYDTTMTVPIELLEADGNYRWRVKPFNQNYGCGNYTDANDFELEGFLGMDEAAATTFDLKLNANPVMGGALGFTVSSAQAATCELRLISMDGKLQTAVRSFRVGEGLSTHSVDVASLARGVYLLELSNAEGAVVRKRVVLN